MSDGSIVIDTALDQSGIEKGIKSLGSIASKGMKVVTTAIGTASAVVTGIGTAATKVGMSFESSMSQVAATMGITVDEISKGSESFEMLKKAAKDAGATTQFSASQASEALNYLALAGYDAEKACTALPTVLNLAAAGGLDLGYASDLVTDSMSALGLETNELEGFVDKLAKTSQKSNTNVAQLGEAILTVGGTAKNLKGGVTEMNTLLGILADNGIKGAEGGTALRNVILSLSAPTDTAAKKLNELGLKVFDAEGNMRPLNETFTDLNNILGNMTQQKRTEVLNTIFNKVDLKSVNALLANSGDRFNELSGYIDNATGSAEEMAKTMNDNLKGDVTILQSALEGLGIVIYESVDNPLRAVAKRATEFVDSLSKAMQKDGFEGMVIKAGDILGEVVTSMTKQAPKMIEVSVSVINAFITGLKNNSGKLSKAGVRIFKALIKGAKEIIPNVIDLGTSFVSNLIKAITKVDVSKELKGFSTKIKNAFENITKDITKLAQTIIPPLIKVVGFLIDNINILLPLIVAGHTAFKAWAILSTITKGLEGFNLATKVATLAQIAFNAVMEANPLVIVGTLLASATTAMLAFGVSVDGTNEKSDILAEKIHNASDSFNELRQNEEETINTNLKEIEHTQDLWKELQNLCDENGNVTDANKERAQFILGELNEALGKEYTMTGNQIDQYAELSGSIDNLIAKKKAMIVLEAQEPKYKEAILNLENQQINTAKAKQEVNKAELELVKAKDKLNEASTTADIIRARGEVNRAQETLDEKEKLYGESERTLRNYYDSINTYETNSALIQKGNIEDLEKVYKNYGSTIKDHTILTKDELKEQADTYELIYNQIRRDFEHGVDGITEEMVNDAKQKAEKAREEYKKVGEEGIKGAIYGVNEQEPFFVDKTNTTAIEGLNSFENNFTNKMNNSGSYAIKNAKIGAESQGSDFTNSMGNIGLTGRNKFDEYFKTTNQTGSKAISNAKDGAESQKGFFVSSMGNIGASGKSNLDNNLSNTSNIGIKAIDNALNGANNKSGNLNSTMSNIGSSGRNSFNTGLTSDTYSIGKNAVAGAIQGANDNSSSLANAMANIAQGALASAKASLGIHSPSRLFRDIVGKNIVKGIEVGVDVETPNLEENIKDNLSNVLNNLDISSLVSRMELAVNYEVASTGNTITQKTINNNSNFAKTVTNNNDNGLTVKIDRFENNRKQDIKAFAEELEFYRRQILKGGGRN